MQNTKSKLQDIASFDASSRAVLQSEFNSTGAATELRQSTTIQSTTQSQRVTGSRSIETPANVYDIPRREAFGQNASGQSGLISGHPFLIRGSLR